MARITNWHEPTLKEETPPGIPLIFVGFLVAFAFTFFSEFLGVLFLILGGIMALFGAFLYMPTRKETWGDVAGALFFGGAFFVFGVMAVRIPEMTFFILALVCLVILFWLGLHWYHQNTREWMTVEVQGGPSIEILRHLLSSIERFLKKEGIYFKRSGNTFKLKPYERTSLSVELFHFKRGPKSVYAITLVKPYSKTRPRAHPEFLKMSGALFEICQIVERAHTFDSFPQVKSLKCKKCERVITYQIRWDAFYCSRCGVVRDELVEIETRGETEKETIS